MTTGMPQSWAIAVSDLDGHQSTGEADSNNEDVATAVLAASTLTVTPVATGEATITLTVEDPDGLMDTETFTVNVSRSTTAELSSQTPGATVEITLKGSAASPVAGNGRIEVDLTDTGFTVPSTIAASNINIKSTGSGSYNGPPEQRIGERQQGNPHHPLRQC